MKLMRIGARGAEHPALLADDDTILHLSGLTAGLGAQTQTFAEV
jgi:hypothetical protein